MRLGFRTGHCLPSPYSRSRLEDPFEIATPHSAWVGASRGRMRVLQITLFEGPIDLPEKAVGDDTLNNCDWMGVGEDSD
jgi:hypothetical protein